MSTHLYTTTYRGRQAQVLMGWDRPLQCHTLVVRYTDQVERPIYCHREDPKVSRYTDFLYYVRRLTTLGIKLPRTMLRELALDALRNAGDREVTYDPAGRIVSDVEHRHAA
ncbi:hypothetical protein OR16_04337 [Cupriavidus basilensis OR16]|uniref:Uncharacterized protein n=1 Tax=Cupriavidus basilensis OR16 TaxID=1127483 RepID=H1RZW1_9BURK|nr:hypothetical protein [Cupriavidus basilensis]EHP44177.1 hypothetical protein OR16_04337 [Cupriavidus basilensis OR16]